MTTTMYYVDGKTFDVRRETDIEYQRMNYEACIKELSRLLDIERQKNRELEEQLKDADRFPFW